MKEIVIDIETVPYNKNDEVEDIIFRKKKTIENIKFCSLNKEFGEIVCIGCNINGFDLVFYKKSEYNILKDFSKMLYKFNNQKIKLITFNGKKFDIPFIIFRCIINEINLPFKLETKRYYTNLHFDIFEVLTNFYQTQTFFTLKDYCKIFNIKNDDKDNGKDVYSLYIQKEFESIKNHCISDVKCTKEIYEKIKNYY